MGQSGWRTGLGWGGCAALALRISHVYLTHTQGEKDGSKGCWGTTHRASGGEDCRCVSGG